MRRNKQNKLYMCVLQNCVCVCVFDYYYFVIITGPNYSPSNAFIFKVSKFNDLKCSSIILSSVIYNVGCKVCERKGFMRSLQNRNKKDSALVR